MLGIPGGQVALLMLAYFETEFPDEVKGPV